MVRVCLLLLLLLISCHDAPRDNPFDAELTPPVVLLSAQVDVASGEATVRWTRFQGARFETYRVERRPVGDDDWLLIDGGRIDDVADTPITDPGLQPDFTYRYRVVVEAAGLVLVSNPSAEQQLTTLVDSGGPGAL